MKQTSWVCQAVVAVAMLAATVGLAQGPSQAVSAAKSKGVVSVNYVKNYGPVFWKKSGKKLVAQKRTLKTGTQWKVFGVEKYGKDYLYDMGGGQRTNSRYMDMYGETSEQALNAVVQIVDNSFGRDAAKYIGPNQEMHRRNQFLNHGTKWKISMRRIVAGRTWYKVGSGTWIKGEAAVITKELSRGPKKYPIGLTMHNVGPRYSAAEINWRVVDLINGYRVEHKLSVTHQLKANDLKKVQQAVFTMMAGAKKKNFDDNHLYDSFKAPAINDTTSYAGMGNAASMSSDSVNMADDIFYYSLKGNQKKQMLVPKLKEIGVGSSVVGEHKGFITTYK